MIIQCLPLHITAATKILFYLHKIYHRLYFHYHELRNFRTSRLENKNLQRTFSETLYILYSKDRFGNTHRSIFGFLNKVVSCMTNFLSHTNAGISSILFLYFLWFLYFSPILRLLKLSQFQSTLFPEHDSWYTTKFHLVNSLNPSWIRALLHNQDINLYFSVRKHWDHFNNQEWHNLKVDRGRNPFNTIHSLLRKQLRLLLRSTTKHHL